MALLDWVSTGIAYSRGKFLEFEDDESNTFNQVDWSTHFYFLNKDKFSFYGNTMLGYNWWKFQAGDPLVTAKITGVHFASLKLHISSEHSELVCIVLDCMHVQAVQVRAASWAANESSVLDCT